MCNVIKLRTLYKITFDLGRLIMANRLCYKHLIHTGSRDAYKQCDKRSSMDRMFIGMILTLAINDQGRMLIGQFLKSMTLPNAMQSSL